MKAYLEETVVLGSVGVEVGGGGVPGGLGLGEADPVGNLTLGDAVRVDQLTGELAAAENLG